MLFIRFGPGPQRLGPKLGRAPAARAQAGPRPKPGLGPSRARAQAGELIKPFGGFIRRYGYQAVTTNNHLLLHLTLRSFRTTHIKKYKLIPKLAAKGI